MTDRTQAGHGLWVVRQAADHVSMSSGPSRSRSRLSSSCCRRRTADSLARRRAKFCGGYRVRGQIVRDVLQPL